MIIIPHNYQNILFISIFCIILLLPLIFIDLEKDRVSTQENRMLANPPAISLMRNNPGKFINDFDSWFKDSIGFRENCIFLYNKLERNAILNSFRYTDGQYVYLIGEEGHHYFADVSGKLIPKFMGVPIFTNSELMELSNKLSEVKTYLENKSIPFIVMFCADKETIYPEFYPKSIKRGSEPIQLDAFTNFIKENTVVDIFNIRQALLQEKNNYLLYYKIDAQAFLPEFAHYNEIGAFFAYKELMKHINVYFPEIIPYEIDDINIIYDEREIPTVTVKGDSTYTKLDSSFFNTLSMYQPHPHLNEAYHNIDDSLPVILVLRDSYAGEMYLGKFIARHFSKTYMIHYYNISKFYEYVELLKPDIVIFESAERTLKDFASYLYNIPPLN